MSREEALEKIKKSMECHDRKVCGLAETCEECPMYVDKDTEYEAHKVLISALSQEPICDRDCEHCTWTECPIEPCDVSVSEKEPNEITEEVTLRFFKNSLKVRWHDFVIYNVEWLKKNWQMEMEIVCGVKPCDDAISRIEQIRDEYKTPCSLCRHREDTSGLCDMCPAMPREREE